MIYQEAKGPTFFQVNSFFAWQKMAWCLGIWLDLASAIYQEREVEREMPPRLDSFYIVSLSFILHPCRDMSSRISVLFVLIPVNVNWILSKDDTRYDHRYARAMFTFNARSSPNSAKMDDTGWSYHISLRIKKHLSHESSLNSPSIWFRHGSFDTSSACVDNLQGSPKNEIRGDESPKREAIGKWFPGIRPDWSIGLNATFCSIFKFGGYTP